MEKSRRRSLSVDPFNHQKSSRYSSLVAVGLWLSFIGLNWTSFSWYAARINSLALSSCLALKHLCKYRVFLKYLDLSLPVSASGLPISSLNVRNIGFCTSPWRIVHAHIYARIRTWIPCGLKYFVLCSSEDYAFSLSFEWWSNSQSTLAWLSYRVPFDRNDR